MECFSTNNVQRLQMFVEKGVDITQQIDGVTIFELACATPGKAQFIEACIKTQQFDVLQVITEQAKS